MSITPKIEHPLSRPLAQDTILVKGSSRMSSRSSLMSAPLPQHLCNDNEQSCIKPLISTSPNQAITVLENPISNLKNNNRPYTSYSNSALFSRPNTQCRLDVENIENLIRSKLSLANGVSTFLQAFRNNDFTGKGKLEKGAIRHCISSFTGRKISTKEMFYLLKRMKLDKKRSIAFQDICDYYDPSSTSKFQNWIDPVNRRSEYDAKGINSAEGARELKPLEIKRNLSINIEKWLKIKLREGFEALKLEFKREDSKNNGTVSHDIFRKILAQFGLFLRDEDSLSLFLARCSMPIRGDINYITFLNRFQDRSENGIAHNVLKNKEHRLNRSVRSESVMSTITAVEAKLLTMLQSDFLSLLGMFNKLDKNNSDVISPQELRAALESKFHLEIKDTEFESFVENLPQNEEGKIYYAKFMSQFDTRKDAKSLWDENSTVCEIQETKKDENENKFENELHVVLKNLVRTNLKKLEEEFRDLDEINSGKLTPEMLHKLLNRMNVKDQFTVDDIKRIWKEFITNKNNTLDFYYFIRHYGYSLKSAAYPNAKLAPPQIGDNDLMMRSRKLNNAIIMLEDNLRSKIEIMWEDLRKNFIKMDPLLTGLVKKKDFTDVLSELCDQLTEKEIEAIVKKYEVKKEKRVSYLEFLRPFAMKFAPNGQNMFNKIIEQNNCLPDKEKDQVDSSKDLENLTDKIKSQLRGDWRTLKRAFQKMDSDTTGKLTLPEFKSVLKLCNVVLDDDEVYKVLTNYDKDISGSLDYKKFLRENASRMSTR